MRGGEYDNNTRFVGQMNPTYLSLKGGIYTWSNNQERPSMSHIDRFLVST